MKYVKKILAIMLVLCFVTPNSYADENANQKNWPSKSELEKSIEKEYDFDIYIDIDNLSNTEYINYLMIIQYSLDRYSEDIIEELKDYYDGNGLETFIRIYKSGDEQSYSNEEHKNNVGVNLGLRSTDNSIESYEKIRSAINSRIDNLIYSYLNSENKLNGLDDSQSIMSVIDKNFAENTQKLYIKRKDFCSMITDKLANISKDNNLYEEFNIEKPRVFTLLDPITGDSKFSSEVDNVFYDINTYKEKNDIYFLYKLGVINGVGDGSFRPNDYITRLEASAIMGKLMELYGVVPSGNVQMIEDLEEVPEEFINYVEIILTQNVMQCENNKFNPNDKLELVEAEDMITSLVEIFR